MAKAQDNSFYMGNKNLPTRDSQHEYTPERLQELKSCSKSIVHFAENYFYIIDLNKGKTLIKLRKYQKRILKALKDNRLNILLSSRQLGKMLCHNTLVPTPDGFKRHGDLRVGDIIYDENGKETRVTAIHQEALNKKTYEVVFDCGEVVTACDEHLWYTETHNERKAKKTTFKNGIGYGTRKTTQQILDTLNRPSTNEPNHRIPLAKPYEGTVQDYDIDPYLFGVWLGDGISKAAQITSGSQDFDELMSLITPLVKQKGWTIKDKLQKNNTHTISVNSSDITPHNGSMAAVLKRLGVWGNKHIPESYFRGSIKQREDLLAGIIDTDGHIVKKGNLCEISSSYPQLASDIGRLLKGLGYKITVKTRKTTGKDSTRIHFKPRQDACKFKRKNERITPLCFENRSNYHYIKEIREVPSVPMRCISVDSPNNLYLCTDSYITTSNTSMMTIFALWQLCFVEDQRVLLIANKEATAINVFKRIRMAYEMCPNWLKPGVIEYAKTGMTLANGSSISVSTTSADSARGESCNVLIIDEMAFIDQTIIEEFWASVMPVITQGDQSKVFIASTPKGVDNKFYEVYRDAELGENEWNPIRVDWHEIDGRDEAWKQKMIKTLGSEEMFNQEYGNVFTQRGESGFEPKVLEELKAKAQKPMWAYDQDNYRLWEKPCPDHVYTIGVDVSEGVGRAASVINICDITDLTAIKLVAQYHNKEIGTAPFAKKIAEIATQWGTPPLLIERNNCGMAVIDALVNVYDYSNIVTFIPKAGQNGENFKNSGRIGIFSHTNTKFTGVNNLRYWMEKLQVLDIPDIETIKEMETFIKHPNGVWKKRNGKEVLDDRVDALIWTLLVLEPTIAVGYYDIEAYDEFGKPSVVKPVNETTPVIDPDRVYLSEKAYNPKMPTHVLPTYIKPDMNDVDVFEDDDEWKDIPIDQWIGAEEFFKKKQ